MDEIIIKEVDIDEALKVHKNVVEFNDPNPQKEFFKERYKDAEKLIIVAYLNDIPIGYIIGFDEIRADNSFYCWMAGVDINYRRRGALRKLMDYQINWAKEKGYKALRIKTKNNKRQMLSFLVKDGFNFISVEAAEDILENKINLIKEI